MATYLFLTFLTICRQTISRARFENFRHDALELHLVESSNFCTIFVSYALVDKTAEANLKSSHC